MSAKKEAWKQRQIEKRQKIDDDRVDGLYELIANSDHEGWIKGWYDLPQQNKDGVVYSLGNQLNLFKDTVEKEYEDPRWYTFNQIKKNGWKLKKGSKASPIYFTTTTALVNEKDEQGNFVLDEEGKRKKVLIKLKQPVIKIYDMFNGSCIEGLPKHEKTVLTKEQKADFSRFEHVEELVNNYAEKTGLKITNVSGGSAFFSGALALDDQTNDENLYLDPEHSKIVMPLKSQFKTPDAYYGTLLHEVVHATKLLGARPMPSPDQKGYAKEELVAELGAMFLSQELGIDGSDRIINEKENSLNYLKNWMVAGVLVKEDLSEAITEATKAVNMIKQPDKAMKIYLEKKNAVKQQNKANQKQKTTQKIKLA